MGTDAHKNAVGVDIHVTKEAPNLFEFGGFQEWTNGTSSQPDGVSDEGTPTVARDTGERDNWNDTPYAVKYTATGAGNEGGKITFSRLKADTKYGIHIRAKATAGDTARLFTTGASINVDQETALTDWTSLPGTFTTDATPTNVVVKFVAKNDGDIVWFDSLMVVEGDVIPTFAPSNTGIAPSTNLRINSLGVGVAATGTTGQIKMQAADGLDTILTMLTTSNTHGIDLYLDASSGSDHLVLKGKTSNDAVIVQIESTLHTELQLISASTSDSTIKFQKGVSLTGRLGHRHALGRFVMERATSSIFLSIGDSSGGTVGEQLNLENAGTWRLESFWSTKPAITIQKTTDTASNQVVVFSGGNRVTPADNDEGYNSFFLDDSTGTQVEFGRQTFIATDVTNTTKAAGYQIELMQNNILRDYMHFAAAAGADTGQIVFNEDGQDIDFRIEAIGQPNAFFVRGSDDNVGIGTANPGKLLHLFKANGDVELKIESDNSAVLINLDGVKTSTTALSTIQTFNNGDTVAAITVERAGANDAADMYFRTQNTGGSNTIRMRITSVGAILMPDVYDDNVGAVQPLLIKSDGQLGRNFCSVQYKTRVRDVLDSDTEWIHNIRVRKYDRIDGSTTDEIGGVAEEMSLVNPEVVCYKRGENIIQDKNGNDIISYYDTDEPEAIAEYRLIFPMIKEIQKVRRDLDAHINV